MNHLTAEQKALLILLRCSLWGENLQVPAEVDWEKVDHSAKVHAIVPLIYNGAIVGKTTVPQDILQQWKKSLFRGILNNERLLKAQSELVTWLEEADIPAVILKGSSVAQYYPQPDLRVLGDIDVLVNKTDIAVVHQILENHGYQRHEEDHDFHVGYRRKDAYVEIHYHVTNFPDSAGGRVTKEILSHFSDEICQGTVGTHTFPVLSDANQALSLLLHMIRHMFSWGIGLRQLSDWAVYMASVDADNFQTSVIPVLERCGLLQYAKVATRTCIDYLGLPDEKMSWCRDVDDESCAAFILDVFCSGNLGHDDNDSMGSLFTDSNAMGRKQSDIIAFILRLNHRAYVNFPITKKCKILLPFFWLYLPLRYYLRSLVGLRPKKSLSKTIESAKKRKNLYEKLNLFEIQ